MAGYVGSGVEYIGLDYPATGLEWYGCRPHVFGGAERLPFSDHAFDSVLLLDVLEHLPEPQVVLNEAWRVLGPGGTLITKAPFLYPLHDSPRDFRRWTNFGLRQDCSLPGAEIVAERVIGVPLETSSLLTPMVIIASNLIGFLAQFVSSDVTTMPFAQCLVLRKGDDPAE